MHLKNIMMQQADAGGGSSGTPAGGGGTPAAKPGEAAPVAGAAGAAGAAPGSGTPIKTDPPPDLSGKHYIPIGAKAMSKLKEAEREKGKAAFKAELDAKAQGKGYKDFDSWLDMAPQAAAAAGRKAAGEKPAPGAAAKPGEAAPAARHDDPEPKPGSPQFMRDKNSRRLMQQVDDERKARQRAERKVRETEQKLEAREARAQLERTFVLAGVKDVDYALSLLERETTNLTAEEAENYDEQAFLTRLKAERPYLWSEQVKPIDTTGKPGAQAGAAGGAPAGGEKPGSGKPSGVIKNAVEVDPKTGKFTMNEQEKNDLLRDILRTANQPGPVMKQ